MEVTRLAAAGEASLGDRRDRPSPIHRAAHTTDPIRVGLIGFGVYQVAIGAFMAVAPGAFFESLGPFGTRNDHYVVDLATFELPLGVALLAAVRLKSWRTPVLAFAALHWTLHAVNHLADIDSADPRLVGFVDLLALSGGAAMLGWLLRRSIRSERWGAP